MTTWKTIALMTWTFAGKVMFQIFNMLSQFVIASLPRSKCLLISWLQSPSAVILEPNKRQSVTVSIVSPSICHEVMGPEAMILVFWMLSFKPTFSLSSFTSIKRPRGPKPPSDLVARVSWWHCSDHSQRVTESKPGVGFCDTGLVGPEAVNAEKALRIPT